jgi:hypothetical protein
MDSEKNITEKLKNALAKKPRRQVSIFKMLFGSTDKSKSIEHCGKKRSNNLK